MLLKIFGLKIPLYSEKLPRAYNSDFDTNSDVFFPPHWANSDTTVCSTIQLNSNTTHLEIVSVSTG